MDTTRTHRFAAPRDVFFNTLRIAGFPLPKHLNSFFSRERMAAETLTICFLAGRLLTVELLGASVVILLSDTRR